MNFKPDPIPITKFLLHFYPKKIREKYSDEIIYLVREEYKIRSKKFINFWIWLISDFVFSLINFYITDGDDMKENYLISQSMRYFFVFGLFTIVKTLLLNLNTDVLSQNTRRVIQIIPFYSDFFMYILLFVSVLGLTLFLNRNNLMVGIVLCVPILIGIILKLIGPIAILFDIQYPYLGNFNGYFISFGMVGLGGYLFWTKLINKLSFIAYLIIGSPLLLLINPIPNRNFTFYLALVVYSFSGLGWVFVGKNILEIYHRNKNNKEIIFS